MGGMVLSRFLFVVAFAVAALACSAAADSSKKPLPVCDAKDPECPGVPAARSPNQTHSDIPQDPVHAPEPTPTPADPAPKPAADAGHDAAEAGPGKFCTQLGVCCKQLGAAGYVTTTCMSVLSTNNEDACYTQHASYKSSGDCT